jgi:hypothetical protein
MVAQSMNQNTQSGPGLMNSITSMLGMNKKPNSNAPPANIQAGGVLVGAPVNYRYPPNMQQPSEEVMEWATTAGAPTPLSGMRNVAHGGRRHKRRHRTRKHKRSHTRKHKAHRRKHTHRRRR